MPTFDIVSETNKHELTNALDQANREIGTRFDFKGSNASYELTDEELTLRAQSEFQLEQMLDILRTKIAKRGLDFKCFTLGEITQSLNEARQVLKIKQGIDKEVAKKITKAIKDSQLKVQAAIQGEQVRVTGKKRDDLQATIQMLREKDFELPLQFINFRD